MNNTINIAMATDDKYVMPTSVAIKSIIENKGDEQINIYIFYVKLKKENCDYFENIVCDNVSVKCIAINDSVIPNIETKYVTKSALIRLYLYKYLDDNIEKIMWLDGDILVLNSLEDFYYEKIDDYYFIGYRDLKITKSDYERLQLNFSYKYINSGVMIMNINKMKNNDYNNLICNFIVNNNCQLNYPDQDIINKLFLERNDIKVLDDNNRFNMYVDFIRHKDIKKKRICLLHYEGPHNKPWKGRPCRHYYTWWKYAFKTNKKYIFEFVKVFPFHIRKLVIKIIHKIEIIIGIRKKNSFMS